MKTKVIKGKYKGQIFEVSQWCNDWFTVQSSDPKIASCTFSPTHLSFTKAGFNIIKKHSNNGVLFKEFAQVELKTTDLYKYSFSVNKLKREVLLPQEAVLLMDFNDDNTVHVFMNTNNMLIGADWSIESIRDLLNTADTIEMGGPECMKMGHGIVVTPKGAEYHSDLLFVKHKSL